MRSSDMHAILVYVVIHCRSLMKEQYLCSLDQMVFTETKSEVQLQDLCWPMVPTLSAVHLRLCTCAAAALVQTTQCKCVQMLKYPWALHRTVL